MNAWEFNKLAGAVLSALLLAFGTSTVLDIARGAHKPEKPGYTLPVVAPVAVGGAATAAFDFGKIAGLLQKASVESGQGAFKKCTACHTPDKGGRNGTGPNLYGIVGRNVASAPGFNYSDSLKGKSGDWTLEAVAAYVHDPKGYLPGNKMAFAGVKDESELADLLLYLRSLSDNPAPLPQ